MQSTGDTYTVFVSFYILLKILSRLLDFPFQIMIATITGHLTLTKISFLLSRERRKARQVSNPKTLINR